MAGESHGAPVSNTGGALGDEYHVLLLGSNRQVVYDSLADEDGQFTQEQYAHDFSRSGNEGTVSMDVADPELGPNRSEIIVVGQRRSISRGVDHGSREAVQEARHERSALWENPNHLAVTPEGRWPTMPAA